jgi:hypothetical protein
VLSAVDYGAIGKGFGRHNERNHISGGLLFTVRISLESANAEMGVGQPLASRRKDKRHCDPIRIGDVSRGQRRFPDWMMAYTVHSDVSVIREIP